MFLLGRKRRGGEEIERKVERLASPIAEELGLELVLVEFSERGNGRLRLVIDKPGAFQSTTAPKQAAG